MNSIYSHSTACSSSWEQYRPALQALAALRMPKLLLQHVAVEDVLQQTFLKALQRPDFFQNQLHIPLPAKLRRLLLQTISDFERRYLACQKRDVCKQHSLDELVAADGTQVQARWQQLVANVTSAPQRLIRHERGVLLRKVLADLAPNEREIIEMRHFEELDNAECAAVLGISNDAASIRYIRALKKMRQLVDSYSALRP